MNRKERATLARAKLRAELIEKFDSRLFDLELYLCPRCHYSSSAVLGSGKPGCYYGLMPLTLKGNECIFFSDRDKGLLDSLTATKL